MSALAGFKAGQALVTRFNKNRLIMVESGGRLAVRKEYGDNRVRGLCEIRAYSNLAAAGLTSQPRLLDACPQGSWILIEHVDGRHIELTRNDLIGVKCLGRAMRGFHDAFRLTSIHSIEVMAGWSRSVDRLCGMGIIHHPVASALHVLIKRDGHSAFAEADPTLIHHDLRAENVLVSDVNEIKILDWEYSVIGHPYLDVERVRWREAKEDALVERALFDGYGMPPWAASSHSGYLFRTIHALELLVYLAETGLIHEDPLLRVQMTNEIFRALQ